MRILVVGATGTVGEAASRALQERGHEVLAAHRSAKQYRVETGDPDSVAQLIESVGELDAVITGAGHTPFGPWDDLGREELLAGLTSKFLGQVEVVRQAAKVVRAGGSFTVTTGILGREPIRSGSAAAAANGALEAWVRASAGELWGRFRINAVSPTVLTPSREKYSQAMPGFPVVDPTVVGQTFVRSVESMETGQIYIP